ncbi:tandem-95 repeat protein, partial [Vibrio cholerae]
EGTVTVAKITEDDVINKAESGQTITVTGTATGGDISEGDKVTMSINGKPYETTVDADGNWSVDVAGADLAEDTAFDVNVASTDVAGNPVTSTGSSTHTVDLEAAIKPSITNITDDSPSSDYSLVTLHGTGSEPGNTIEVFARDSNGVYISIGTTIVVEGEPSPTWTLDISNESAIPINDNEFLYAKEIDSAGNISEPSDTVHYYHGTFNPAQSEACDDFVLLGEGDDLFKIDQDDANDKLVADGGAGRDTAQFNFASSDAQIVLNTDGSVTVTESNGDVNTLIEFERFKFTDGTKTYTDLFAPVVTLDRDNDDIIDSDRTTVGFTVGLPVGAVSGATLILVIEGTESEYLLTNEDVQSGQIEGFVSASDIEGQKLTISAEIVYPGQAVGLEFKDTDILEVNQGPVASEDSASTDEDTAVTINVLSNDSDGNGDTLTVTGATILSGQGTVSVVNNKLVFTPEHDFNGVAEISYTISDGQKATSQSVVSVTVNSVNDVPEANDDTYTTHNGLTGSYYGYNQYGGSGLGNIDSIQDALTVIQSRESADVTFLATNLDYALDSGNGSVASDSQLVDFLGHDSSSMVGSVPADATDGIFHMSGALYLESGEFALKVRADDGYMIKIDGVIVAQYDGNQSPTTREHDVFTVSESGFHTVEIVYWDQGGNAAFDVDIAQFEQDGSQLGDFSPLLDAPTISSDLCTVENQAISISADSLLANDSDADGDPLSIVRVFDAVGGAVSISDDGSIQFVPDPGFSGDATFSYEISDGNGGTDEALVTIHVTPLSSGLTVSAELTQSNTLVQDVLDYIDSYKASLSVTATATSDADYLQTNSGAWVESLAGDDVVEFNSGHDMQAKGGEGNDILIGGATNNDYLLGEGGNDIIVAGTTTSSSNMQGGDGNDILIGQSYNSSIQYNGGAGIDTAYVPGSFSDFTVRYDNLPQGAQLVLIPNQGSGGSHDFYSIETIYFNDGKFQLVDGALVKVANVYELNIDIDLVDNDGSEVITEVTLYGVPDDAELTVGDKQPDGSWVIPSSEVDSDGKLTLKFETSVTNLPNIKVVAGAQEIVDGEPSDLPKYATDETGVISLPSENSNGDNTVVGTRGDDVILGDSGGYVATVEPGKNYNIALIVDTSGSMGDEMGNSGKSRLQIVEEALTNLIVSLKDHDGVVNVKLIAFDTNIEFNFEAQDITHNPSQYEALLDRIEDELKVGGWTDYSKAFDVADSWFSSATNDNAENLAFFLTDGKPTVGGDDDATLLLALEKYQSLSSKAQVQAIGIGSDISTDVLKFFDNTSSGNLEVVPGLTTNIEIFDFSGSLSGQKLGNEGTVWIENGELIVWDRDNGNDSNDAVWQSNMFTIGQESSIGFDLSFDDGEYSWLVYDHLGNLVDSGKGSDSSGYTVNRSVESKLLAAGVYSIQVRFDANRGETGRVRINDISLLTPVLAIAGEVENVTSAQQLEAALQGGSISYEIHQMGDDVVSGGAGADILFGDSINTDSLPWGINGNPVKPDDLAEGAGLDALYQFLSLKNGYDATDTDVYDYIKSNHSLFDVEGDNRVGNDTVIGGEGDDILYGQGGDDILLGEEGNDILVGGTGDDTLIGGLGDDILTGGEGADIFKWVEMETAHDRVTDFNRAEGDALDLADLFADVSSTDIDELLSELSEFGTAQVGETSTSTVKVSVTGDEQSSTMTIEKAGNFLTIDFDGASASDITNRLMGSLEDLKL